MKKIKIQEDILINKRILLEKGDEIKVLSEGLNWEAYNKAVVMISKIVNDSKNPKEASESISNIIHECLGDIDNEEKKYWYKSIISLLKHNL